MPASTPSGRPALEHALAALPYAQRDAVRLRIVEELDYPEIALQLRCTKETARQRVSRGLRVLRSRMEAHR